MSKDENFIIFKVLLNIKGFLISCLMYTFRIFPIKNNRILIISYYGKEYGDSGKYVVKELLKSNKDYEIYWTLSNMNAYIPNEVKKVKYKSLKYYYILATSKIWINNCRFPFWIKKRNNQKYIQLWHGNIALKKIELDVPEKLGYRYIKSAISDNKKIDYMISNGKFCTNILCRGAFKYKKDVLEYGTARNDILVNTNDDIKNKVKEKFKLEINEKIILYAPTFRKNYTDQYNIDFIKIIEILKNKYNLDFKVLLRLHPNVRDKADIYNIKFSNDILDACHYDDMQELIAASDIVITDYSSVMFDALIANKPVLLYVSDIDNYNDERGTYFEFDELPFYYSENNNELFEIFNAFSFDDMKSKYNEFKKRIGLKETGEACKKIVSLIDSLMGDKNE